ncbi:phage tail protein [Polaribacter sp. SA4-10]|nr:phage tail protein [Polaribacter sp. SA4-10]
MLFVICAMSNFDGQAQEGFLGEVRLFAGNFTPRGWAICNGQIIAISNNQALYSILGTTYGGDGRTTFALPDLQGRVAVGQGTGPGLSQYREGQQGGTETNRLSTAQLPAHSHDAAGVIKASNSNATTKEPAGNYFASSIYTINRGNLEDVLSYGATSDVEMNANAIDVTVGNTGGSQSVENRQPYLAMNYIICLSGTYPARN